MCCFMHMFKVFYDQLNTENKNKIMKSYMEDIMSLNNLLKYI